jgi:hypothetical protein
MTYMTSNGCSKPMTYIWVCFYRSVKKEPFHLRTKLSATSPTLKHGEKELSSKAASATVAPPCARAPPPAAPRSWRDPPHAHGQVSSSRGATSPPPLPCRTMTPDVTCLGKLDPVGEEAMAPWWRVTDGAMVVSSARWRRSPLPYLRWEMEHRLEMEVVE